MDILAAAAGARCGLLTSWDGGRALDVAGLAGCRGGALGFELCAGPATALTDLGAEHFIHSLPHVGGVSDGWGGWWVPGAMSHATSLCWGVVAGNIMHGRSCLWYSAAHRLQQ